MNENMIGGANHAEFSKGINKNDIDPITGKRISKTNIGNLVLLSDEYLYNVAPSSDFVNIVSTIISNIRENKKILPKIKPIYINDDNIRIQYIVSPITYRTFTINDIHKLDRKIKLNSLIPGYNKYTGGNIFPIILIINLIVS